MPFRRRHSGAVKAQFAARFRAPFQRLWRCHWCARLMWATGARSWGGRRSRPGAQPVRAVQATPAAPLRRGSGCATVAPLRGATATPLRGAIVAPLEARWSAAAVGVTDDAAVPVLWLQTTLGRLGCSEPKKNDVVWRQFPLLSACWRLPTPWMAFFIFFFFKATNGARTHNHKVFNLVLDQLGYGTLYVFFLNFVLLYNYSFDEFLYSFSRIYYFLLRFCLTLQSE